jgi:hypothetical protein
MSVPMAVSAMAGATGLPSKSTRSNRSGSRRMAVSRSVRIAASCSLYARRNANPMEVLELPAQFSVTSGTIFQSRKLAIRDYLAVIALSAMASKALPHCEWPAT